MNPEIALPILIPLLGAAVSVAFWRHMALQRHLAVLATGALLAIGLVLLWEVWHGGILVMDMGVWPAPFGIALVADLLAAIMVVLAGFTGFAVTLYSLVSLDREHENFGYYPLLQLLLAGVCGAFLTGDIFNLFVWFEVMLIASFALLVLGGRRTQMEGGLKYVTLNLIASAIFLTAVGLLYGMVGTLNMADLAVKLAQVEAQGLVTVLSLLFMIAFGIKAAAFPLFFWLPASYHTPPVAISAVFAGLLTKVGVYALYRVFTLIFTHDVGYTHTLLLWGAGLTMLTGVLGAAAQFEFRRILSFHIISQIGYMLMGLALFTPLALLGGIFYIVHHIVVKTNLFLVSGVARRLQGSYELRDLGGLYRSAPGLSVLFLIPALSLAGMPPLSGFFGKFILVRAGLEAGAYAIVFVALLVGLLTLYSMLKIWAEVFWKAAPEPTSPSPAPLQGPERLLLYAPISAMAAVTVAIGLGAAWVYDVAEAAAAQLLDPALYVEAVLGRERLQ